MRISIERMNCDIWVTLKNSHFVPTHIVDGVVENKYRDLGTKEKKKNVQYNLKAKTIITTTLVIDEFFSCFSL